MMRRRRWYGKSLPTRAASTMLAGLLAACTHPIPMKPAVARPPEVSPTPLAVGVYYSSEFRQYKHAFKRAGDAWEFPVGEASVKLLDQAISALFESVAPVASRPPIVGADPKIRAVIEPRIESFDVGFPLLTNGLHTAEVAYRFTVYAAEGEAIVSWTVRGSGTKAGQFFVDPARSAGEAADFALQEAAMKLMIQFREQPEMQAWLRRSGGRGTSAPPR